MIVDQLDRISNDGDRHRAVFWEGRGKLRALNIHVVYTTPIEYAYSRALPTLNNEYDELLGFRYCRSPPWTTASGTPRAS